MSAVRKQSNTSGKARPAPKAKIVEEQLEHLASLRPGPLEIVIPELKKALDSRVNVVIAKAAAIVGDRQIRDLLPDVLIAFQKLFDKPVASDPQCWGKHAIAKALKDLDYAEHAPFLRGFHHIQMEPTWGGHVDTAVNLRAECALGIAACIDIPRNEKLTLLVDGCADLEHVVRIEILRALEQLGGHDCMLLLRMKALLGDREPAVVGQAIESVLRLEGEAALDWAQRFLKRGTDEMREEAALAISASRIPGAVDVLLSAWKAEGPSIARSGYLRALSQSRDPAALEFLLGLIEAGPTPDAIDALHALASHAGRPESVARIAQAVELRNQDHVRADFHNLFPALPSAEA